MPRVRPAKRKALVEIRRRIAQHCEERLKLSGIVEVDESYFGPRRVRGKRGRGAGHKTIVFGIFKRNGHVYTEIVPDAKKRRYRRSSEVGSHRKA